MKILISKKASILINSFSDREKNTYDYLIELYKNTIEKIEKCTKEIVVYENNNPLYKETIKHQTDAEFRLKYIFQCLNVRVNYNYQTEELFIKSDTDKF